MTFVDQFILQLLLTPFFVYFFISLTFVDQFFSSLKEHAIRSLLSRHANELYELIEEFLLDKLHIPSEWIDEAKSFYTNKDSHSEIYFVLRSKQWNRAHNLILNILAPELILKGKTLTFVDRN